MLVEDIEYVIFRHPDLAVVRQFMLDYGLLFLCEGQADNALYMRSYNDAPFSYVTTEGEAAFVGMGFRVASDDSLQQLATRFGVKIEDCPHPGGGAYIHTVDPEGRRLEFVFGAQRAVPVPADGASIVRNDAHGKNWLGRVLQPGYGPSRVLRLGHVAVFSQVPRQMVAWYSETLGMKSSELIHDGNEANVMASFMHLDKGKRWTDHHTLAIVAGEAPGLDHISFECRNFSDRAIGRMLTQGKGHRHHRGVGREVHDVHMYDHWTDPAGFLLEHYSDGDLVNEDSPTLRFTFGLGKLLQWDPELPGRGN